MPRPVCVKCKIEYRPEKIDIIAEEMVQFGSYKLWCADLWKCPICGHQLISGYGREAYAERFEPDYREKQEACKHRTLRFYGTIEDAKEANRCTSQN